MCFLFFHIVQKRKLSSLCVLESWAKRYKVGDNGHSDHQLRPEKQTHSSFYSSTNRLMNPVVVYSVVKLTSPSCFSLSLIIACCKVRGLKLLFSHQPFVMKYELLTASELINFHWKIDLTPNGNWLKPSILVSSVTGLGRLPTLDLNLICSPQWWFPVFYR